MVRTTLPFEENSKVIGVGSAFQQGYAGSHKVLSSTKQQYQEVDTFAKTYKANPAAVSILEFKSYFLNSRTPAKATRSRPTQQV